MDSGGGLTRTGCMSSAFKVVFSSLLSVGDVVFHFRHLLHGVLEKKLVVLGVTCGNSLGIRSK